MADERVVVHLLKDKDNGSPQVPYTKLDSKVHEYDVKKDEVPDLVDVGALQSFVKAEDQLKGMKNENLREFYRRQNSAIEAYKVADQIKTTGRPESEEREGESEADCFSKIVVRMAVYLNIGLLTIKVIAAAWSGSLALVASAIDSALDILSGAILYFTNKAINKYEPYKYPQGKSRLEPIGIMLFACAMAMAGLQVIVASIQELASDATATHTIIRIDAFPIAVMCVTIGCKTAMWLLCFWMLTRVDSGAIEAIKDDCRNDTLTNTVALGVTLIASRVKFLWWFDPVGAILLSFYIVFNWYQNGKSQIAFLIGRAAPPEFISQIVYMAAHHAPEILRVDTVLAYHYGIKYMVECHIGLNGDMTLRSAHDIGESLENSIEKLDLVEKCFVHLDYEWNHKPEYLRHFKKMNGTSTPETEKKTPDGKPKEKEFMTLKPTEEVEPEEGTLLKAKPAGTSEPEEIAATKEVAE